MALKERATEVAAENPPVPDRAEIVRALKIMFPPEQPMELRGLGVVEPKYRAPHTIVGFFNDPEKLANAAMCYPNAKGLYTPLNPFQADLFARSANISRPASSSDCTSDSDITMRTRFLVDCDPRRPSGISSTQGEHDAAIAKAVEIREALKKEGWPDPVLADSGNGGHLLYKVELPVNDDGLIKRVLKALASRFDDDKVSIDTSVFNPARICKLYGSVSQKGSHTIARPYRVARILEVPPLWTP